MTSDEFRLWADAQSGRYELINGHPLAMAAERIGEHRAKAAAWLALRQAVAQARRPCDVCPDGVAVRVDQSTVFKPHACVRCGPTLDGDLVYAPDPMIVVEILAPSSRGYDTAGKLAGYFKLPSLQHYLVVDSDRRVIMHHRRREGDLIATHIVKLGTIDLDPPGIEVAVIDMLGDQP